MWKSGMAGNGPEWCMREGLRTAQRPSLQISNHMPIALVARPNPSLSKTLPKNRWSRNVRDEVGGIR